MVDPTPGERIGTYLTPEEAKEVHKAFMSTFMLYVVIALVAHALVYFDKPWFPL